MTEVSGDMPEMPTPDEDSSQRPYQEEDILEVRKVWFMDRGDR